MACNNNNFTSTVIEKTNAIIIFPILLIKLIIFII